MPLPVANTFVHFSSFTPGRRSRSEPIYPAHEVISQENQQFDDEDALRTSRLRRPQKHSRQTLCKLTLEELCCVVRSYGLPKLRCEDDRRFADALLPLPSLVTTPPSRYSKYLSGLKWQDLIRLVHGLVKKRKEHNAEHAATYLEWACEALVKGQLRDAAEHQFDDSVLPWRMSFACAELELSTEWAEVSQRLACNELVIVKCGTSLLLKDEIRRLLCVAFACQVTTLPKLETDAAVLNNAAVLYVAGHHVLGALTLSEELDLTGLWLVVLNMCCTEELAQLMISRGARYVVCWPCKVPDAVAADFGVGLIGHLYDHSIDDAFSKAQAHSKHDALPKLLSRALLIKEAAPSSCGSTQDDSQMWSCSLCDRVFPSKRSLASHTRWHNSSANVTARTTHGGKEASTSDSKQAQQTDGPPGWKPETRFYASGVHKGRPYVRYHSPGGHVYASKQAAWRAFDARQARSSSAS